MLEGMNGVVVSQNTTECVFTDRVMQVIKHPEVPLLMVLPPGEKGANHN